MYVYWLYLELQLAVIYKICLHIYTIYLSLDIYLYFSLPILSLSFLFIRQSILTVELSHITVELALYDSIRDSNVENRDYRQKIESDFLFFS